MQLTPEEQETLNKTLAPLEATEVVQLMGTYVQHGTVSTLDHCRSVAAMSLWISRRLHLKVDNQAMLTGALLHDFFLYDWHGAGWRHSYRHAEQARRNALKHFNVDEATQHVIRSHMWPVGITHVPHSREAIIVCIADKCVTLRETIGARLKRSKVCG